MKLAKTSLTTSVSNALTSSKNYRGGVTMMKAIGQPMLSLFLGLLISFAIVGRADAQSGVSTGSILGFVMDPSGAGVLGAEVVLRSDTGYQRTVVSADGGSYQALLLPPGTYDLTVTQQGFKTFVRSGLTLGVDQNLRVDINLTIGELADKVVVAGSAVQVDTHSSQISSEVTQAQVESLPLGGNRFLRAVATVPGVIPPTVHIGVLPNPYVGWLFGYDAQSAGAQNKAVDYQVDSSSTRQGIWGGSPILPTSVSIQEVKVITNSFSAEYGTGSAMVVNAVSKSGTNEIHGSVFDILGNDKFNSRTFNSAATKAPLRYNQFGGDIGGPVIFPHLYNGTNRTFFYFDYEGIRQPQSTLIAGGIPPTEAQKAGDFSALSTPIIDPETHNPFPGNMIPADRLSPVVQYLTSKMPLANFGQEYRENVPTPSSANEFTIRGDQNLGPKDRLFGRFWRSIPRAVSVSGTVVILPDQTYQSSARNHSLSFNNSYTFTPTLLNQTSFATTEIIQPRTSLSNTFIDFQKLGINGWNPDGADQTAPQFNVPGYNLNVGTTTPSQMYDKNYLFSDSLTWVHGRHSLKFGLEIGKWLGRYNLGPNGNGQSNGVFTFGGSFTGDGMADFVLGLPDNLNKTNLLPIALHSTRFAGFVQDDFKVSRKLTLNLGLRYRIDSPWVHDKHYGAVFIEGQQSTVIPSAPLGENFVGDKGVPAGLYPTDYNDWAPRVGFAYDPTGSGKTAIRGAFGIYNNIMDWAPAYYAAQQQPYGQVVNMVPASLADPFANITNPYPYSFDPTNVKFNYPVSLYPIVSSTIRSAYVETWSLGVQHQVRGVLVEANYVGSQGHHLMSTSHINPALYIPGNDAQGNPLSTLQNENDRRIIEPSPGTYGAIVLNSDFANSNYNALQVSARGRVTNRLLVSSAWTWGHSIDNLTWGRSVDVFDSSNPFDHHNDRGNSDFDYRHIFTASVVWNSPKISSMPNLVRAVLGDWQASTIFTAQTGGWLTVFSGQDRSLSGVGADRADALLPSSQFLNAAADTRGEKFAQYINPAAFGLAAIGTFGNAGRNTLNMPGGWKDDFSLQKRFPIHESFGVAFRTDFYNVFNHPLLNGGVYNGLASLRPVSSPAFGRLTATTSGRIIQFKLGFYF